MGFGHGLVPLPDTDETGRMRTRDFCFLLGVQECERLTSWQEVRSVSPWIGWECAVVPVDGLVTDPERYRPSSPRSSGHPGDPPGVGVVSMEPDGEQVWNRIRSATM